MKHDLVVEPVQAELIAAVRAKVRIPEIVRAWKPALDQVWAFLRTRNDLQCGHNLFLYHHPEQPDEPMDVDFGVQIARSFEPHGNVRCVVTPAGEAAKTVHFGPYDRLHEAHEAVHAWCAAHTGDRSDGRRGKPTATGPTTRRNSKPRSAICCASRA